MAPPGFWSWFLHTSPWVRLQVTFCPRLSRGTLGYITALQEMFSALWSSQMPTMDSLSPPGLVKSGLPESTHPVHLQSSSHVGEVGDEVAGVGVIGEVVEAVVGEVVRVVVEVVGIGDSVLVGGVVGV